VAADEGPREGDLLLTRFRLLHEVRERVKDQRLHVLPVRIRLDAKSMIELAAFEPGSRLGCLCVEERFARSMGRAIERHGMQFEQRYGTVDRPEDVDAVYRDCDMVVTSCRGLAQLERMLGATPPKPTILVQFEIDPASVDAVASMLAIGSGTMQA
jgi:hypothetical protein